jgi:hypothetical protein
MRHAPAFSIPARRANMRLPQTRLHGEDDIGQYGLVKRVHALYVAGAPGIKDGGLNVGAVRRRDDSRRARPQIVGQLEAAAPVEDCEIPAEEVDIGLDHGDGAPSLHQREIVMRRGEPLHRIRAEPDAEIVGRVLDSGRQRGRAHGGRKIVGELSFVRPRPERRLHDQHVGAGTFGGARERNRFAQVRSGDRGHERRPAGDILDRLADDYAPLGGAEGADLGHEAEHGDAMRA